MSDPSRPGDRQTDTLPPGADRFWGQFARTRAGRTQSEPETPTPEPEASAREEGQHCLEWCPICRSADIVRATTSPEAIGQVQAIQNEAIGVLKSFLAIYAERSGQAATDESPGTSQKRSSGRKQGSGSPSSDRGPEVRDISID